MHKLPTRLPRLDAQKLLHVLHLELAQLPHALHPVHDVLHVLRGDPRQRPQELLRRSVHASPSLRVVLRPDVDGLGRVRLRGVRLEVVEDLRGRVGRGRPEDADAREREREEDEFGLDGLRGGRGGVCARVLLLLGRVLRALRVVFHVADRLTVNAVLVCVATRSMVAD